MRTGESLTLGPEQARNYLVGQAGLRAMSPLRGAEGVRALLQRRRCIQLDPLDRIGTNADLVALARVRGIRRGDVYRHLLPGHAFEHFAKERCLLPASAFPWYRERAAETPWWRLTDRLKRLPPSLIESVLEEVAVRGPVTAAQLEDRGRVEALDWHGWKGTGKAATMALEVLWLHCRVVVCGRQGRQKVYDIPERALPRQAVNEARGGVSHGAGGRVSSNGTAMGHRRTAQGDFERWALIERVEAAGLLSTAGGPWWSMLSEVRTSSLPHDLVEEGALVLVRVQGSRRTYLAPPDLLERTFPEDDGQLRILGPLDPLVWDRKLVQHAFGFEYVWEVYIPPAKRRWGYYVCPLLHRGDLVGRIEAHLDGSKLVVDNLWPEPEKRVDQRALDRALARHERACG